MLFMRNVGKYTPRKLIALSISDFLICSYLHSITARNEDSERGSNAVTINCMIGWRILNAFVEFLKLSD